MIKIIKEFATEAEAVAFLSVGAVAGDSGETLRLRGMIRTLEEENEELLTELRNLREEFNAYVSVQKMSVPEWAGKTRELSKEEEDARFKNNHEETDTRAAFELGAQCGNTDTVVAHVQLANTEADATQNDGADYVGAELDAAGMPWDERIHSSTRSKLQNGNWKLKRGVDPDLVATITQAQSVPAPEPTEDPNLVDAFAAAGDATPLDVVKLITQHRNAIEPLDVDAAFRRLGFVDASGNPFALIELMNRPDLAPAVYKELTKCAS